jgi:hypothetical protein
MKVAVWDTYVMRKDNRVMHFDVIVPEDTQKTEVLAYGQTYLHSKGETSQSLTTTECRFCHIEQVKASWQEVIEKNGYYIYEMENCH